MTRLARPWLTERVAVQAPHATVPLGEPERGVEPCVDEQGEPGQPRQRCRQAGYRCDEAGAASRAQQVLLCIGLAREVLRRETRKRS